VYDNFGEVVRLPHVPVHIHQVEPFQTGRARGPRLRGGRLHLQRACGRDRATRLGSGGDRRRLRRGERGRDRSARPHRVASERRPRR
jgi:hypothetical protein